MAVLDIDGTLLDSNYQHSVAWSRAFDRVLSRHVPVAAIHRAIGMGGDRLVAHVAGDAVEEDHGDEIRDLWEKEYDAIIGDTRLFRDARHLLDGLRSTGLKVVLASSSIPRHAEHALRLLNARSGPAPGRPARTPRSRSRVAACISGTPGYVGFDWTSAQVDVFGSAGHNAPDTKQGIDIMAQGTVKWSNADKGFGFDRAGRRRRGSCSSTSPRFSRAATSRSRQNQQVEFDLQLRAPTSRATWTPAATSRTARSR